MANARDKSGLRVTPRAAVAAAIFVGCLAVARPVSAQSSQAYLSLGAGATDLSGGADWLVLGTPVAVGAELGAGNLFVASLWGFVPTLCSATSAQAAPLPPGVACRRRE